ncbi:MAG: hypothetical protein D3925_11580 [Candidatus Electrothrix sp. AR5]|nr:hypothetical protein [Candidatus Electrothrix sp. AR5]
MALYINKMLVGAVLLFIVSSVNPLAAAVVMQENFNACQIPVGWEVEDLLEHSGIGSCGWQWRLNEGVEENYTGGSEEGCFVLANSDECGVGTSMDTVLVTPSFDCTNVSGTILSFKYDSFEQRRTSTFVVEVSANGGSDWVAVWQRTQSDRGPKIATADISAYADGTSSVLIRFRYTASYDWWWQIDDVTVSADEKEKFNWLLFLPSITAGPRSAL